MSLDIQPVMTAVRAAIGVVWPEVVASGVALTGHASTIPFSDRQIPFATVVLGPFRPDAEWGVGAVKQSGPLELWYVDEVRNDASRLNPKLAVMQDYLNRNRVFGNGSLVDLPPALSFADNLTPNLLWSATLQTQRAGMVGSTILMLDVLPSHYDSIFAPAFA